MKNAAELFKALFYPKTCAVCGCIIDEEEELCDYCHETIVRCDPIKRCPRCGTDKRNCQCKKRVFRFDGCIAPFVNTGAARRAMHLFKFRRRLSAENFFARQMALCVRNEYRDISFGGVCFVPMPLKKQLARGYNQSRLLAEKIAEILKLPLCGALYYRRSGKPQHTLSEKERFENVKGLYYAKFPVRGKTLLLVDDIKTTGATLDECAGQLLAAGADSVYCVTALISDRKLKSNNTGKTGGTMLQ